MRDNIITGTRQRARFTAERWARALAYARGTQSRDQASRIIWDCQATAGWFPLETLSVDSVIEAARERWADCSELAADAADRVGAKWNSTGAAEDWALDLITDYAEQRGIALAVLDPAEAPTEGGDHA
jgi:hypothetical protein